MNYTIADMLKDNLVPGIEQMAYGSDLGTAEIAAVTVQEYPADDFVQKGDLVLSTAEGCTENEDRFAAFLDELSASGACGVLFAFRDASYKFPLRLRLQAQKSGLPVFRIPWKVRFAQVQSDLIRRIHRRSMEYLTERRIKQDFLWNLASGNYESAQQMAVQGRTLKFDLSLPYACVRLLAVPEEGLAEYSDKAAETADAIESAIESCGRLLGLRVMYAARAMEFLLYVEGKPGREEENVRQYYELLRENLSGLKGLAFAWGIAPCMGQPADFVRLAQQAELALQYAKGSASRVYVYKDAKEAALIAALLRDPEAVSIAQETLADLFAEDAKGSSYLQTLAAYFRCCGNASKAADELYIHRISLLQRLEKIEKITGLSLKDHRDRLLLQLCVRMTLDE